VVHVFTLDDEFSTGNTLLGGTFTISLQKKYFLHILSTTDYSTGGSYKQLYLLLSFTVHKLFTHKQKQTKNAFLEVLLSEEEEEEEPYLCIVKYNLKCLD